MSYEKKMKILFLIATGGALGALLRQALVWGTEHMIGEHVGWGTLLVNIAGSFCMGLLAVLLVRYTHLEPTLRPFLMTGFLGALTTFSAFSLDAHRLWERDLALISILYISASVVLSILALLAGMRLAENIGNG